MENKNKINKKIENDNSAILNVKSLDRYFPKGDKRRGEALAVCIEAFLEGKLTGKKIKLKKNIRGKKNNG